MPLSELLPTQCCLEELACVMICSVLLRRACMCDDMLSVA